MSFEFLVSVFYLKARFYNLLFSNEKRTRLLGPSFGFKLCCSLLHDRWLCTRRNDPYLVCRLHTRAALDDRNTARIDATCFHKIIQRSLGQTVIRVSRRAQAVRSRIDDYVHLCIRRVLYLNRAVIEAGLVLIGRLGFEFVTAEWLWLFHRRDPGHLGRDRDQLATTVVIDVIIDVEVRRYRLSTEIGRIDSYRWCTETASYTRVTRAHLPGITKRDRCGS